MFNLFKGIFLTLIETKPAEINPATGLPLIEDSNIDIGGNFLGFSNDFFSTDYSVGSNSFSSFD